MEVHKVVRRRGSHIFWTIGSEMAVRLSSSRAGRPLPPRKISSTNFCQRLSRNQGLSAAGRIRSIEKSNNLIGIRTRDLSACRIVPQPTTLPRAPNAKDVHEEMFPVGSVCRVKRFTTRWQKFH
jgi:hypothetical protein